MEDNQKIEEENVKENQQSNALDGLNLQVQNTDVLKNTDIGVLRNNGGFDKSKYTRTTKPDGTVVEEVKMNQKTKNKGLVSLGTDGVNIGDNALNAGLSKEVSEDVVSFADSIWGSRQAATKTQETRQMKLNNFKEARDEQFAKEAVNRKEIAPTPKLPTPGMDMTKGL